MQHIARSSNGRTTPSGGVYLGSNPSLATKLSAGNRAQDPWKLCYNFVMNEDIAAFIGGIAFLAIWGYAIKRLGLLWGLSVGWIPAAVAFMAIFGGLNLIGDLF